MEPVLVVLFVLAALIGGAVIGFFASRKYMMKYFEENPPVDEAMIRTMMAQMGQKPSEKKVQQIVQSMKYHSKKSHKK